MKSKILLLFLLSSLVLLTLNSAYYLEDHFTVPNKIILLNSDDDFGDIVSEKKAGGAMVNSVVKKSFNDIYSAIKNALRMELPTSTDLRFKTTCEGLQSSQFPKIRKGILDLNKEEDQLYNNIGVGLLVDLYDDGHFEAVEVLHSMNEPRPLRTNLLIVSHDNKKEHNTVEGMSFLNDQPKKREIRKVTTGDLNGDGLMDLIVFNYGEQTWLERGRQRWLN